jgi:hypothetical protein
MNEGMENLKQIEELEEKKYFKKEVLDFVKTWLNSNITDELQPEVLKADSRDLLEKIEEMENETIQNRS